MEDKKVYGMAPCNPQIEGGRKHNSSPLLSCSFLIIFVLISSTTVFAAGLPTVGEDTDTWGTILNNYLIEVAGLNATELNETMVNGTNIYSSSINTTHILDSTILDADISDIINLTLGEKITFTLGEVIDNIVNGWIRVNGSLNVTQNVTAQYFIGNGSQLTDVSSSVGADSIDGTELSDTITLDTYMNVIGGFDFAINNSNLFVDVSTERVGIGTGSPSGQLSLGNGSEQGCFRYNVATNTLEVSHQCNSNFSIISDAGFYGSLEWQVTPGCNWQSTATSFSNFASVGACDDKVRIAKGLTTSTTSIGAPEGRMPAIKFDSMPAGIYHIVAKANFDSDADAYCNWRFSDGTYNSTPMAMGYANGQWGIIEGELHIPTDQGQTVIQIQADSSSGAVECQIYSDGKDTGTDVLSIYVYYFPQYNSTTGAADYAEWFEKENELIIAGDLVGLNKETGKVRVWREGDPVVGIASSNPALAGNKLGSNMHETHALVGLVGQLELKDSRVVDVDGAIYTPDGQFIGYRLADGKVFINRDGGAIQEQQSQIEQLKTESNMLKNKLDEIEKRLDEIMLVCEIGNIQNQSEK